MRPTKPDDDKHQIRPTIVPRRKHGMVIALVGPDGVGKSSQTAKITAVLQEHYSCKALYLGSGDGGWKIRRSGKRLFRKLRDRGLPMRSNSRSNDKAFGTNHSLSTAFSGMLSAVERYLTIRRAMRLARSGSLVICDRWPQNLRAGIFDGPLRLHLKSTWIVRQISRLEGALYRRMEKYRPDLTIHLVSDFETSEARKPGDRTRADFEQRLGLMGEMRARDPTIKCVDAAGGFDDVTQDLLRYVLESLTEQQVS